MNIPLKTKCLLLSAAVGLFLLSGCSKTDIPQTGESEKKESMSSETLQTGESHDNALNESDENDEKPDYSFAEELALKAEKYYINTDILGIEEGGLVIDGLGEVKRNNNRNKPTISAVTDVITGENRYYAESYAEYIKKGDYDYEAIPHSRLYDLDGNLISDWKNVRYGQAYYDWILEIDSDNNYFELNETFNSALVNLKDGRRIEKVYGLEAMGDYLILRDGLYLPTAIMAPDGSMIEFPGKDKGYLSSYAYRRGDYMIMESDRSGGIGYSIFDKDLNLKYESNSMSGTFGRGIMAGNYLCIAGDLKDDEVYDLDKCEIGKPAIAFTAPSIYYFDGDYAVTVASDKVTYQLQRVSDGKVLYSSMSEIFVSNVYSRTGSNDKAQAFYLMEDGFIKKLDKDGKIAASYELPVKGNIYLNCDEDYICYTLMEWDLNQVGVLDLDLNEIYPFGKYLSITKTVNYNTVESDESSIWICGKNRSKNYSYLYDVYNEDMELIAENLNSAAYPSNGKFAFVKGFTVGLMDLDGNILYSSRITDLTDN